MLSLPVIVAYRAIEFIARVVDFARDEKLRGGQITLNASGINNVLVRIC